MLTMQQQGPASTTGKGPDVKIASITLPPDVKGEVKGELVICFHSLHWKYRKPPPQVQVRFRWWGSTADTVVPFHSSRGAGAAFPVTCGPRYLSRYLKDMGSLTAHLEECPSGRSVGTVTVEVSQLDIGRPLETNMPCYGAHQQLLATADLSMRVGFTNMITSFEMNEHLASTDKQLPLYPVPGLEGAKSRQQQTTPPAAATVVPSALAGKENVATSHDNHQKARSRKQLDKSVSQDRKTDTAVLHQQPQPAQDVADACARTAQQQQQQQQMIGSAIMQRAMQPSAPAADAPLDPMLEVIRKAEQLKQAMEQAAGRGISVALPSNCPAFTYPQLQQQQLIDKISPHLQQQQACQVYWPNGGPLAGLKAVDASQQPSAIALEAVRSCLYGDAVVSLGATPGQQLMEIAPAQVGTAAGPAVIAPAGDVMVGSASAEVQQQLSPLVAALLQMSAANAVDSGVNASEVDDITSAVSDESGDITELEDLEELEDLLLQELLSVRRTHRPSPVKQLQSPVEKQQQQAQPIHHMPDVVPDAHDAAAIAATSVIEAAADGKARVVPAVDKPGNTLGQPAAENPVAAAADTATTQTAMLGPQLLVTVSAVEVSEAQSTTVLTAIVKSAGQSKALDVTALLQQHDGSASAVTALVQGPESLSAPSLTADKSYLAVELWKSIPASTGTPANKATSELLGIARVLLHCGSFTSTATTSPAWGHADCLASDTYPLYNVLRGQYTGSIQLSVTLAPEAESDGGEDVVQEAPEAVEEGAVLGIQHVIAITLHSVNGLPSEQELQAGGQLVPESRFLQYSFPGEEPLFTQEVECISAPVFSALAQHTVVLPPDQSLVDCIKGDEGQQNQCLRFLVYNKWQDDTDSQIASGSLPLQQVLALSQVDHPSTSESSSCTKSFFVQMQLAAGSGEAAVQPPKRAALLQITVSYAASNCYKLPDSEYEASKDHEKDAVADMATVQAVEDAAPGDEKASQLEQQQPPSAAATAGASELSDDEDCDVDVEVDDSSPTVGDCVRIAAELSSEEPCASDPPAAPVEQLQNNSLPWHQGLRVEAGPAEVDVSRRHHMDAAGSDHPLAGLQGASALDPAPDKLHIQLQLQDSQPERNAPLTAEICVEVIRACGLQAAVLEAEKCLGGHSSLLGSARRLGPHPYVTMNLLPNINSNVTGSSKSLAQIKTPFQAQTFCPQFHHKQLVHLTLDSTTVTAIVSQASSVELWHHCPRSQAVAAALSRGQSSSFVMSGQQQVLLGSAVLSLCELLVKPQGIRSWLVLKSQYGQAVGAVQVAVYFTHIAGQTLDCCSAADAPLCRYPQLQQLLPPPSTSMLTPLLTRPHEGLEGQLAAVSIHIQELMLPGGDHVVMERPRIANYVAAYRLPGREREEHTQMKANSSLRSTSSSTLLGQSWHVEWQYCGRHWVTADWRLGRALIAYPLVIAISRQESSRHSSSNSSGGSQPQQLMVPVGSVEVDMSPLLSLRSGAQRPSCRWLSGEFAVIHPMAKNLGNMRLKVKVLLELQPAEAPHIDLVKQTAAYWQISGPLAALAAPSADQMAKQTAAAPVTGLGRVIHGDESDVQAQLHNKQVDSSSHTAAPVTDVPGTATGAEDVCVPVDLNSNEASVAGSIPEATAADAAVGASTEGGHVAAGLLRTESEPAADNTAVVVSPVKSPSSSATAAVKPPVASGRLRAEMTHASAPASAAVSRSISPALDSPQQEQQQHSQQSQLPSASQQHEQQLLSDIRVGIESALNLDLPQLPGGQNACLYVQYVWKETGSCITTPLVMADCGPRGQTASAKWFHSVHLPMAFKQHATAAAVGSRNDQELVLQVFLRVLPQSEARTLPPLYAAVAAEPAGTDVLLGHAVLDLATLQILGSIEGWYGICNQHQLLKGQVKVSLTPLQQPHNTRPASEPGLSQQQQSWLECPTGTIAAGSLLPAHKGLSSRSASNAAVVLKLDLVGTHEVQQQPDRGPHSAVAAAEKRSRACLTSSDVELLQSACDTKAMQTAAEAQAAELRWVLDADLKETVQQLQLLRQSTEGHDVNEDFDCTSDNVTPTDELLQSLMANLKELDQISAALAQRVKPYSSAAGCQDKEHTVDLRDIAQQQDQQQQESRTLQSSASGHISQQPALTAEEQPTPAANLVPNSSKQPDINPLPMSDTAQPAAAAARAHAFRHVQTLSDDEDYLVMGAAVTDSDTDTEELMGRVDWSMAQCSDDFDAPPGPPLYNLTPVQPAAAIQAHAAESSAAAAAAGPPAPLNNEDWMFDIGRPTGTIAAAAVRGRTVDTSSSLVNPAQLSQHQAATQQAAAAQRLAQLEAASAAAAADRAAAVERASRYAAQEALRRDEQHQPEPAAAGGGASQDVWDELAAVEEQEEQQQQQQQQQQQVHDTRELPEDLNARLDMLLASFQAAVNPVPATRAATAITAATTAATAAGSPESDSFSDDDFLPADRVVHTAADDRMTVGVGFANCLPPIQDDFVLECSDGPQRRTAAVEHTAAATIAAAAAPAADTIGDGSVAPTAAAKSMEASSSSSVLERFEALRPSSSRSEGSSRKAVVTNQQLPLTAVKSAHPAMHPAGAAAAAAAVQSSAAAQQYSPSAGTSCAGSSSSTGGLLPVVGFWSSAAMDDMFSISKRPQTAGGGHISHSGLVAAAVPDAGRQHDQQSQQQQRTPAVTMEDSSSSGGQASVSASATASSSQHSANSSTSSVVPVLGRHSAAAMDDMFSFRKSGSRSSSTRPTSSGIKHPYM